MAKVRELWVRTALIVSLLVPVWFLVAALGAKFGLLDWRIGFDLMTLKMGLPILWGAFGFALIGLGLALFVPPRGYRRLALFAVLITAVGLGYGLTVAKAARAAAPIHDISTDLDDPPAFSAAVLTARAKAPGGNGVERASSVVTMQRAAYGDIKSLITDTAAFDAFQVALDTAQAQKGWVIDRNDAASGIIEAHAATFWYGFTDDIVIRVRALPDDSGTTIDMRSISRVGASDLGTNAARVRAYMKALNTNLGEAATGG